MNALKEESCVRALQEICSEHFNEDEYSLGGPKECAVCLEKVSNEWSVYEKEKNSRNDSYLYDNIVEACLDLLRRLSLANEYKALKDAFFERIIIQKSA
ncbi:MAG: hypothetical protein J5829_00010 [Lachnospiraceae bacterium]|nr:hypothetical protein [Lachnospiraceae bacterium]